MPENAQASDRRLLRLVGGTSFRAACCSNASFDWIDLRNIEIRISHVVEEVRVAARHDRRHDLHDLHERRARIVRADPLAAAELRRPPPIARGFPSWKVPDTASGSATKTLDCASFEVWVAKSGKTGFGAMLHVRGDHLCTAQIRQATFEYPRERVGTAATLPATITAGTVDAPGTLYLPFAFDNEASWNRGERHGTLKIEIATAEHQETWVVPLDHVHPGAHVVVPRNGTNAAPLPSGAQ